MQQACLRALWLCLAVALAACTMPYASPVVVREPGQQPTADFPGLQDLIAQGGAMHTDAHVLWAHGMCSHDWHWAYDRIERIAAVLGAAAQVTPPVLEGKEPYYVNAAFETPKGRLTVTFLVWSPMTDGYKTALRFDTPGPNGDEAFPYTRAVLNGSLKATLMNDCLPDAVVYAGRNGDAIRGAMQHAVCNFLGGVIIEEADGKACDLNGARLDRPTAIVTESLGSKFVFDAVRTIWDHEQLAPLRRAGLARRLAAVSIVYLVSNQIPLLDMANPIATARSSLGRFIAIRNQPVAVPSSPLKIVDFSDPNDLLSYRLLPSMLGLQGAELINATVSNDDTWLGLFERPDTAHCGYAWNRAVIGMIATGYRAGGAITAAPPLKGGQCL